MGALRITTIAGVVFASVVPLNALPACAATVEFDLTITYSALPNPNLAPGNLTGMPQFFSDNGVIDQLFSIAVPNPPPILPVGQTYFARLTPTDPCFGQTSCAISFSFAGICCGGIRS